MKTKIQCQLLHLHELTIPREIQYGRSYIKEMVNTFEISYLYVAPKNKCQCIFLNNSGMGGEATQLLKRLINCKQLGMTVSPVTHSKQSNRENINGFSSPVRFHISFLFKF